MKISIKDVFLAGVVSTLLFPVVLISVLLINNTIHFSMGVDNSAAQKLNEYLEKLSPDQQLADEKQLPLYQANVEKEKDIKAQLEHLETEKKRIDELRMENLGLKKDIEGARNKIEKMVSQDNELKQKKLTSLAQMYAAMKPIEAAPILMNLSDEDIADILLKVPEVRSQGKLMGAIGAMDEVRAAKISALMGLDQKEK